MSNDRPQQTPPVEGSKTVSSLNEWSGFIQLFQYLQITAYFLCLVRTYSDSFPAVNVLCGLLTSVAPLMPVEEN